MKGRQLHQIARPLVAVILVLSCAGTAAADGLPAGSTVVVGIVHDVPGPWSDRVTDAFRGEMAGLLSLDYELAFPADKTRHCDGSLAACRSALGDLLADPEVDLVLALGTVASLAACGVSEPAKPLLAPLAVDHELQDLPYVRGTSGVRNLSYLTGSNVFAGGLSILRDFRPVSRLAILGPRYLAEEAESVVARKGTREHVAGLEVTFVALGPDPAATVAGLPEDTDAVITVALSLSDAEVGALAAALQDSGLPSFSVKGRDDVKLGILAGLDSESNLQRLARRTSLHAQSILQGTPAGDLAVAFLPNPRPVINLATARALRLSPSWQMRLEAELIDGRIAEQVALRTLDGVIRQALQDNLDLAARRESLAAGRQEIALARANLLPQLEVGASGVVIDEDRAAASLGSAAERTYTASASLSQVVYSEDARANVAIQRRLQRARESDLETARLDVALAAGEAFLNVQLALALEHIERDNLGLTRTHLEMARTRERLGLSGPAEVYRWESEIARRRRDFIDANQQRNQAEMQLNRLLDRPLEEPFRTEAIAPDDPRLTAGGNWFVARLDEPARFAGLRGALEAEAQANAPELQELTHLRGAQERELTAAGRAYYLPTIALQAGYDRVLDRSGAGTEGLDPSALPPALAGALTPPDDDNWSVGLALSLPLFEGGARKARRQRARSEVTQLDRTWDSVALIVAQRARSAAHAAGSSHANIANTRDAADAAARTLEVVEKAYSRGAAGLLDLLDAQNAALVADQLVATAVHDFLLDYLRLQRAIGRFDALHSPEELRADLEARLAE